MNPILASSTVLFTILFSLVFGIACGYAVISAILHAFARRQTEPQATTTAVIATTASSH
jgi:purine-cytosine permease-like protein